LDEAEGESRIVASTADMIVVDITMPPSGERTNCRSSHASKFIRVVAGGAVFISWNDSQKEASERFIIAGGTSYDGAIVPRGVLHNVYNASATEDLLLQVTYTAPSSRLTR